MLTIRWGLDDVGIYTLNEAVIKINTVLSYQWDIGRDLEKLNRGI